MIITKPDQLKEGMKLKGKWGGIPVNGRAYRNQWGLWYIMPYVLKIVMNDEINEDFTDLESVEGIRAAKEGDVLVKENDNKVMVLLSNDFGAVTSCAGEFKSAAEFDTWEELEEYGYTLKGAPNPEADPIEVNGKKYDRDDISKAFEPFYKKMSEVFESDEWKLVVQGIVDISQRLKELEPID